MKKWIPMLLAFAILLGAAACGKPAQGPPETMPSAGQTEVQTQVQTQATIPSTGAATEEAETQRLETMPATSETQLAETMPATSETQRLETIPVATQPPQTAPTQGKPAASEPHKPAESKPAETVPPVTTEPKPLPDGPHKHDYSYKRDTTYTYCNESGFEYMRCSCGDYLIFRHSPRDHHLTGTVITPATHDKEGLKDVKCVWCPYTGTEVIPKVDVPYFTGFEIVSVKRPNAHYLTNGQDLLTRLYGENKAFQLGDSMVVKVNMSDGGSDFTLSHFHDCIVKQEGNLLHIQFETDTPAFYRQASFLITVNDRDGNRQTEGMIFELCCQRFNYGEGYNCISELRKYGERLGMQWVTNGTDFVEKYNGGYTWNDESRSLTGCTIHGTDDLIEIPGNPDWIDEAIWLLDQYKAMGFTRFLIGNSYHFTTLAE